MLVVEIIEKVAEHVCGGRNARKAVLVNSLERTVKLLTFQKKPAEAHDYVTGRSPPSGIGWDFGFPFLRLHLQLLLL